MKPDTATRTRQHLAVKMAADATTYQKGDAQDNVCISRENLVILKCLAERYLAELDREFPGMRR